MIRWLLGEECFGWENNRIPDPFAVFGSENGFPTCWMKILGTLFDVEFLGCCGLDEHGIFWTIRKTQVYTKEVT